MGRQTLGLVGVLLLLATVGAVGAGPVVLREVDNRVHSYRGGTWQTVEVSAYVENIAFEKRVTVHYRDSDGVWKDMALTYVTGRGARREVWHGYLSREIVSVVSPELEQPRLDMEFVLRYEVGGVTYWDNNGGANYKSAAGSGELITGKVVVDAVQARKPMALANGDRLAGRLSVGVLVKNLGFAKKVQVRYTTDGWKTVHVKDLEYNSERWYGYSRVAYPNAHNVEYWSVATSGDEMQDEWMQEVQLAVSYQVNGETFWDNNDGANYRFTV